MDVACDNAPFERDLDSAVERTCELSIADLQHKDIFQLFASAAEELGEVSRELLVERSVFGNTYIRSDEGSKAESVDLANCA